MGIIKNWISNDMQESPEQICKIVESFFTSFRQNL
ncbi:MAG: TetR family transcriptional regulator C-terminal domain-containing protein [Clostridioides difficile]|nr:TetR family transcriptional regulator C-terminal domain-containing protein [Clostridioides difficile]